MPIHEYACDACGERFEQLVRHDTVVACPRCASRALTRQLSVFSTAATAGGAAAAAEAMAARATAPGPCGSCGHPDGPGACAVH